MILIQKLMVVQLLEWMHKGTLTVLKVEPKETV